MVQVFYSSSGGVCGCVFLCTLLTVKQARAERQNRSLLSRRLQTARCFKSPSDCTSSVGFLGLGGCSEPNCAHSSLQACCPRVCLRCQSTCGGSGDKRCCSCAKWDEGSLGLCGSSCRTAAHEVAQTRGVCVVGEHGGCETWQDGFSYPEGGCCWGSTLAHQCWDAGTTSYVEPMSCPGSTAKKFPCCSEEKICVGPSECKNLKCQSPDQNVDKCDCPNHVCGRVEFGWPVMIGILAGVLCLAITGSALAWYLCRRRARMSPPLEVTQERYLQTAAPTIIAPAPARTMQVQVPHGVVAGQMVQATTPEGVIFQVAVPAHVVPGSMFTVAVPR